MSKLLINEPPLQVLPSLAVKFGLNEAMILQQMHYWLQDSRNGVEKNGKRWIFNSYKDWKKQFPFWSERTIQRAFLNLESASAIISRQEGTNRRKFYTVNYEILDDPSCQNGTMNMPERNDDDAKMAHSSITEKTTKTTQRTGTPKPRDPLLDNPAVVAYKEITHRTPNEIQRLDISKSVNGNLEEWRQSVAHWIGHGWSKSNVTGMLSFLKSGGVGACSQCNRNSSGQRNYSATSPKPVKEFV